MEAGIGKARHYMTQTPLLSIVLFVLAKICFGLIELPHEKKSLTYIPFLVADILLMCGAIAHKIYRHKFAMLRWMWRLQVESFLLWAIGLIMMVFAWGLMDSMEWSLAEIGMVLLCQALSIFMFTLMSNEQFMSKMEFIAFEIILGLEILAVSLKTVGFIKYNNQSQNKDLVLLNLTTQIALMILIMDSMEKCYRRFKGTQLKDDMFRLENEMVFTNKTASSQPAGLNKEANLREKFTDEISM